MDSERTSKIPEENKEINWNQYNYPPLIKVIHFRPSEIPQQKKFIVMSLFLIHIVCLLNCLLNFIDNCIEGGLGILYSILFLLIFNPLILFLFYRGYVGICQHKSKLRLYTIFQPIVIVLLITISIVDFLGFNGFIRVADLFDRDQGATGAIGLIVSLIFLAIAIFSGYIYFRICKEKSILTKALL